MFIELRVFKGECAKIYARAEPREAAWVSFPRAYRAVEIVHNKYTNSLQASWGVPSVSCDNDLYLSFVSNLPFSKFCEQFASSEYNQPSNYHFFTHNCSNAAHYALKIAGIQLPLQSFCVRPIFPFAWARIPGIFLSPVGLYELAETFKTKELYIPPPTNKGALTTKPTLQQVKKATSQLLSLKLHFYGQRNRLERMKKTIADEVHKLLPTRPHHADVYLTVLTTTLALMNKPTPTLQKKFRDLIPLMQDRNTIALQGVGHGMNCYMLVGFLSCLSSWIMDNRPSSEVSFFSRALFPEIDWICAIITFCLYIACAGYCIHMARQDAHTSKERLETPLSKAMEDLISQYEGKDSLPRPS